MNINGIETPYQNYAVPGTFSTKGSRSESTSDIFKKEIVNWEKQIKETLEKERENDSKGSIQMSEKKWRNLMKKVDNALDIAKDNNKKQEQDNVAVSSKMQKTNMQFLDPKLVQTFSDTVFFPASGKKEKG